MTSNDPIINALAALATEGSATLLDSVFARWVPAPSALGPVLVAFTRTGVQYLRPADPDRGIDGFATAYRARFGRPLQPADTPPAGLLPALHGRPTRALAFDLAPLTAFERSVLDATRRIPSGQTRPYGWVAREAGHPRAVRAVGSVLARNPVPLLVPCHRVVRVDGDVGGYLFGSAHKERLLRAEGANLDEVAQLARHGVHYLASDTTHIVCFPTCRNARRITAAHRRGFGSLGEAVEAGFRPCRTCRPAAA